MNAKKAKLLRKATGYKNQSATPGVMDFPGISKMVHVPVFDIHKGGKPVLVLNTDGTPKTQIEALSKPGILRATEPKGVYRQMKKLASRYGAAGLLRAYARGAA